MQVAQIYDQEQNPMNGRVYHEDGISPTLRTPTGGLSEPCILGYTRDGKGNVTSRHEKEIAGALHTSTGSGGNTDQFGEFAREPIEGLVRTLKSDHHNAVMLKYRIRKLTPTECFRLMGVEDADIDKLKS